MHLKIKMRGKELFLSCPVETKVLHFIPNEECNIPMDSKGRNLSRIVAHRTDICAVCTCPQQKLSYQQKKRSSKWIHCGWVMWNFSFRFDFLRWRDVKGEFVRGLQIFSYTRSKYIWVFQNNLELLASNTLR